MCEYHLNFIAFPQPTLFKIQSKQYSVNLICPIGERVFHAGNRGFLIMFLLIGAGLFLYFCMALAIFALSALELSETGRGSATSICAALFAAIFWPVTISVMSTLVILTKVRHS
ncbi:hypothetical protein IWQ49_005354 [Labrenzia sp. EL_126]|nr:hypothetical protein [Labrenzia sp. EL_126]